MKTRGGGLIAATATGFSKLPRGMGFDEIGGIVWRFIASVSRHGSVPLNGRRWAALSPQRVLPPGDLLRVLRCRFVQYVKKRCPTRTRRGCPLQLPPEHVSARALSVRRLVGALTLGCLSLAEEQAGLLTERSAKRRGGGI